MDNTNQTAKDYKSRTYNFKIAVVILLFVLTLFRLAFVFWFPSTEIVSDKIFLFAVLVIVIYLWMQELADFHKLVRINKDLEEAHEQLKEAEIDTIASLVKAVEAKDQYTSGHSERVTKIALAIAEAMDANEEMENVIARAGILHDIGKISISDTILNKKEPLTDAEWAVIKEHSENSFKILQPLKFLSVERNIILQHHERYDGGGYPKSRKDGEICLEALILAVADAFDAMNSKRSYRESLSKDAIIDELTKGRGKHHSPEVVDAFLALLKKKPQLWEK